MCVVYLTGRERRAPAVDLSLAERFPNVRADLPVQLPLPGGVSSSGSGPGGEKKMVVLSMSSDVQGVQLKHQ